MSNIKAETIGNVTVSGYVNKVNVAKNYFLLGTGSYTSKDGSKRYKSSLMVFVDSTTSGHSLPPEGSYVEVKGDLTVSESTFRKDGDEAIPLKGVMNVRVKYQLALKDAPQRQGAATPAPAPASSSFDEDDI